MAWSRVNKTYKRDLTLKWWYHKVLCELNWFLGSRGKRYYHHLNKLCDQGYNLYGEKCYNEE